MKIAIVGSGILASKVLNHLNRKDHKIDVFEIGNNKSVIPKSEFSKSGDIIYEGDTSGRRLGVYGTSTVWGGQIFNLTKDECHLDGISRDIAYDFENKDNKTYNLKEGTFSFPWNKKVKKSIFRSTNLMMNSKVIKVSKDNNQKWQVYTDLDSYKYDRVFLCAGVFGNASILYPQGTMSFSDHISQKIGTLSHTEFSKLDLEWSITKSGLRTKRFYLESIKRGHYIHFVYNRDLNLVKLIRRFITKKKDEEINIFLLPKEIFKLFFKSILKFKFPAVGKNVDVYFDCESSGGEIDYKKNKLKFLVEDELNEHTEQAKKFLENKFITFQQTGSKLEKYEDIYHPFNLNSPKSFKDYFENADGLFRLDTGVLNECGATNPTGVMNQLIDEIFKNEW